MAGIPCAGGADHDEAAVGVMVYGPEGGTTDLCPSCLAAWALDIAQGAYGPLQPAQAAQTADTATQEREGTGDRPERKRRHRGQAQAQERAESEPEGAAPLEGAEH